MARDALPVVEDLEACFEPPPPERGVFANRTLNLRSIRAIGFDMDYTLVHYRVEDWERRAYYHCKQRLLDAGWPVGELEFDPRVVSLGLVLDLELGNVVKANRFGYVKKAAHGTRMLTYEEQREVYSRVLVDLAEPRWVFMNTLFGLSEGCMYAQAIDLLDAGRMPQGIGYQELYKRVRSSIDETHMEGTLKAEIISDPDRFVVPDPELPLALLDLKHAGKKLMVITNSEWSYTKEMMRYAFDPHLPKGMTWRELFDIVVVSAAKPGFFNQRRTLFEVVDDEQALLRPARAIPPGSVCFGGDASYVEDSLGVPGEEILYVGDHIFADVHVSKSMLRWRTALVVRELEEELRALEEFKPKQRELTELMDEKERVEHRYSQIRLHLQRKERGYGPQVEEAPSELKEMMQRARSEVLDLDARIAPLAKQAGELANPRWGLLMRAGNDKSHLARQIERYADVYMSRVSNLLELTPFVYMRSPRGSLPHDSGPAGGA
jgi:HAD superfamily 5'-nucleotidase-like hydrolase